MTNPPLPQGWICRDGYYIPPHMIAKETTGRVVCTNGKTITHQEGTR